MNAGIASAALFLAVMVGFLAWIWHATRPELDPPPGVVITHFDELGWNYIFEDQKGMIGTGYLTRRGAIRAAREEYEQRRVEQGYE